MMSGIGRKSLKRRMNESQEDQGGRSRAAKEAKTEVISVGLTEASNLILQTLTSSDWACDDSSAYLKNEANTSRVSESEENEDGSVSRGTVWQGDSGKLLESPSSQICISCKREPNGKKFNCETQTFHFFPTPTTKELNVNEPGSFTEQTKQAADSSLNLRTVKVELDAEQESFCYPVICYIRDCESRTDEIDSTVTFYTIPSDEEQRLLWSEALNIIVPEPDGYTQQYVCSQHFITPSELPRAKAKTRKKKTCDMLLAEEAEKIKQGLSSGRPKRTPKPNKNYDWAELVPFIKSEPLDQDELELIEAPKTPGFVGRRRKQLFTAVKKEDKENERPSVDHEMGTSFFQNDGDEYGENVSLPSHPRAPPPKPKGRPHRIRDICTQTDAFCSSSSRQPLREVKVQCNLTAEPLISCSSCSTVNWMRLEELLVECVSKIEGEVCDPLVMECLRQELCSSLQPSYATNVLKLLSGMERDILESAKDIILVSSQDEEVEIESVIHPEVEAPMTGVREITPKVWQKKNPKWTRETEDEEEMLEDDPDGLGLQEATEMDDDEFHPGFPEPEEEEEEEEEELDQELDDEDWNVNKRDGDSGVSGPRKKQKKVHHRNKKGRECLGGETGGREVDRVSGSEDSDEEEEVGNNENEELDKTEISISKRGMVKIQEYSSLRRRQWMKRARKAGDDRWLRGSYNCPKCDKIFTTRLKMERHHQHIHLGIAPWTGSHLCEECGKTFTQKVGLRVHRMHKHGDPKQFPCNLCNYEGVTKAKLARHLKSHSDDRIYTCEFCGVALKTTDTYRNHMALHTNEGRYQCNVCKKAFHHKQYYEDHYRSHFDVRDYNCDICQTAFKTNKSLRTHIRGVHLNDKRIICDICGARFMTNFNLRGHMKKHARADHSDAKYQCDLCSYKFHSDAGLSAHKHLVHSEGYQPVQIKVESDASSLSTPVSSIVYTRIKSEPLNDEELGREEIMYTADVEHIIEEGGSEAIAYQTQEPLLVGEDCVKAVEAVVEDHGEELPRQHVSIIYVYHCNDCGTMFTSQDLLTDHMKTVHIG
ncbi:uncharacterized protein [Panulirus ornatus]|uniref:uncharacterized protein isoform X1 n=1 Tax=Panulirus ornatus TaxID=150431 RepID=UPI003A8C1201